MLIAASSAARWFGPIPPILAFDLSTKLSVLLFIRLLSFLKFLQVLLQLRTLNLGQSGIEKLLRQFANHEVTGFPKALLNLVYFGFQVGIGVCAHNVAEPVAVYPSCPDAQPSKFSQIVGGHGGYTAVELSR